MRVLDYARKISPLSAPVRPQGRDPQVAELRVGPARAAARQRARLSDRHPLGDGAAARRGRARRHHGRDERGLAAQSAAAAARAVGHARLRQRPQRRARTRSSASPTISPAKERRASSISSTAACIRQPMKSAMEIFKVFGAEPRLKVVLNPYSSPCGRKNCPIATWPWPRSGTRPTSCWAITAPRRSSI